MRIPQNQRGFKALIFDMVNTLIGYQYLITCRRFSLLSGIPAYEINPLLHSWELGRTDLPMNKADLGLIDAKEFAREIRVQLGIERAPFITDERIFSCFDGILTMQRETRTALHFLGDRTLEHGSYLLGLVTNINVLNWERHIVHGFPTLSLREEGRGGVMDFHAISYKEGVAKPDKRIYEIAFARARAVAEKNGITLETRECAFFDDHEPNVRAAEECGMRGFLVDGTRDMHTGERDCYAVLAPTLWSCGITEYVPGYTIPWDRQQARMYAERSA